MLLEVANLDAFYGDLQALHGLDIEVDRGESVALVGANGAGKTTFMRCLAGLIEQKRGGITFGGNDISRMPAEAIARRGIALVPEGRMLFPSLNVEENLLMGALGQRPGYWNLQRIFALFPLLAERRRQMPNNAVRRPAGIGRDRPRDDGQSRSSALRRDLARARTGGGRSDLRFFRAHSCRGRRHRRGRARRQARGVGDRSHLLSFGRTRHAAGAKPKARCRRADPRLFRHLRRAL
jgi:ABC-type Fe3+/spermidine/putrescine transport system ATPase subunit